MYCIPNNCKLVVTGDALPKGESSLCIVNHQEIDWLPAYVLSADQGVLGSFRTIIKKSVSYIPVVGWTMYLAYWPFISRDFAKDGPYLERLFKVYKASDMPLNLWLYPEGTRQTPKGLKNSQEYARKNGYPVFDNVLLPRPKGFIVTRHCLKGTVDYVYDMAFAYKGWEGQKCPSVTGFIMRDPRKRYEIHVDVRRIPLSSLPEDDGELKQWLLDSFARKDKLLSEFYKTGAFAGDDGTSKCHPDFSPGRSFVMPSAISLSWPPLTLSTDSSGNILVMASTYTFYRLLW
eukprot:CAMPEP_0119155208 /NCGR_PEP_ID=MMETSP1310-20130426/51627_1 /TAXON_ID=464262 /ORGANISM="Genus nov. species nov., Strain RCC2339" /LENGTH=288 /DNA_ID=CAMNT_0007147797 /DNA_START=311 /DNA_END=1178 /DNA_ORIENTATION=+